MEPRGASAAAGSRNTDQPMASIVTSFSLAFRPCSCFLPLGVRQLLAGQLGDANARYPSPAVSYARATNWQRPADKPRDRPAADWIRSAIGRAPAGSAVEMSTFRGSGNYLRAGTRRMPGCGGHCRASHNRSGHTER